jgi:CheY-like chemotaxis protein
MGGEIWLQSEEDKGTEITFQLPVTLGTKASSIRPSPARADSLTWGVSAARQHENQLKHTPPIKTMAMYTRNNQVWEFLSEMCASIGLTVVNNTYSDPIRIDSTDHDSVLLDIEFFEQIPVLCLKLLGPQKPVCVVLFSEKERGPFFSAVSEAENVILLRRPLAIHRLSQSLKEPWKYMGGNRISRRASPFPPETEKFEKLSLTSERQNVLKAAGRGKTIRWDTDNSTNTVDETLSAPEKRKVLMVEDNEVNGRMGLKLLSIAGYSTELAEDGAVALEMITKPGVKYDIVLMDCQVHLALITPNLTDACDGRLGMHATNTSTGNGREVSRAHTNCSSDCKCRR